MVEILKSALAVVFVYAAFLPGNILAPLSRALWKAPWWIRKPTFECPTCMTSTWGTACFFLFSEGGIEQYITFIMPLGGALYITDIIIGTANQAEIDVQG